MDEDFLSAVTAAMFADTLAQHSSDGEEHLLDAASHFALVRVLMEGAVSGMISEENFDRLAEEAYSVFVESSVRAYHTWLNESGHIPPLEPILVQNRTAWDTRTAQLRDYLSSHNLI